MSRFTLVLLLSFGVAVGPNVCCCAFAKALSAAPSETPEACDSCCCGRSDDADSSSPPASPHDDGRCPCKKHGKRELSLPTSADSPGASTQWAEKLGCDRWLPAAGGHSSAPSIGSKAGSRSEDLHAPAARGRSPILRC